MYGAEIWGLEEGWKQTDTIHVRFCKNVLEIPRYAANGVAELEWGIDSRKGKVLCMIVKCWQRILQMDKEELVWVWLHTENKQLKIWKLGKESK